MRLSRSHIFGFVRQLIHSLVDTMLCVLRGLKSPSSPLVVDKIEEDISRLFRLMCKAGAITKTSVTKPKWLDMFNYVMYVFSFWLCGVSMYDFALHG